MIDTVRLTGNALFYRFVPDYTEFKVFKRKGGNVSVPTFQAQNMKDRNGKSLYRVYHSVAHGTTTVELNPHKIIFGDNIFNYETDSEVLYDFLCSCAAYFFGTADVYVNRIDIGGVVTYRDISVLSSNIESLRGTRLPGARLAKYKNQSYKDSIFYASKTWSVKIYNKGREMKYPDGAKLHGVDLCNTLRYEKTYRTGELKRLGMPTVPYYGVPLYGSTSKSFSMQDVLADFYNVFQNWERQKTPYLTTSRGTAGLLSVIDQNGQLSDVEASGVVSRWTIQRYRQKKRKAAENDVFVEFSNNLTEEMGSRWFLARTFGLSYFLP